MPVTTIDGEDYVDGGLGSGIALEPAIEDGYERFVVLDAERGFRLNPPVRLKILTLCSIIGRLKGRRS